MKNMQGKILIFFILCLTMSISVLAASGVSNVKLTYDITSEGKNEITVERGEVITVAFAINRTDSGAGFSVSALQNEIMYDQSFFEYVTDSAVIAKNEASMIQPRVAFQTRTTGDHIVKVFCNGNFTAAESVVTFRLRVLNSAINTANSGWVTCSRVEAFETGSYSIVVTENNLKATLKSDPVPETYPIVITNPTGGAIITNPAAGTAAGSAVRLSISLSSGYTLTGWSVIAADNTSVDVKSPTADINAYHFIMPAQGVRVTAVLARDSGTPGPSGPDNTTIGDTEMPLSSIDDLDVPLTGGEACHSFTDVKNTDWFHAAVDYVEAKGWFGGVGNNMFSPNTQMTRAMFATVLLSISGEDASGYTSCRFDDVADDAWYMKAVEWGAERGIILGVGNNKFAPNSPLTREQMVVLFYRYFNNYLEVTITGTGSPMSGFSDRSQVSSWAVEAMTWATLHGVIKGNDQGMLTPKTTTTRAVAAQFIANLGQSIEAA